MTWKKNTVCIFLHLSITKQRRAGGRCDLTPLAGAAQTARAHGLASGAQGTIQCLRDAPAMPLSKHEDRWDASG